MRSCGEGRDRDPRLLQPLAGRTQQGGCRGAVAVDAERIRFDLENGPVPRRHHPVEHDPGSAVGTDGRIVEHGVGAIAGREFPVLAGYARELNSSIFVSRGVGTVYMPVRINCPPDVAVLTLRSTFHG